MAEIYDIFKLDADFSSKDYTVERTRSIMSELLARADTLLTNGVKDVAAKIKTELIMKKCVFGYTNLAVKIFMEDAATDYATLTKADQRAVDSVLRDLIDNFETDITGKNFETAVPYLDILDEYIEFKTKIDTISPEAAAEVDRLAEMSDEEFEAEMNKPDEEEEEEFDELDTPITQDDFDNLSIAELIEKYGSHDTALCLIGAEGGVEKLENDTDDAILMMNKEDAELIYNDLDNGALKNHLHILINYGKFNCRDCKEAYRESLNAIMAAQEASMNGSLISFPGNEEKAREMASMSREELKAAFAEDDAKIADAKARAEEIMNKLGIQIPNTEEFNPEYDIPDEKLYPQE